MKSASLMLRVVARRLPTFTWAPAPKMMPFGLIRKIRPLASNCPRICEVSPPTTRLRATALEPGWMNRTSPLEPMLNPVQLMIALGVPWVIWRVLPSWLTVAEPPTIWAPWGSAHARGVAVSWNARRAERTRHNQRCLCPNLCVTPAARDARRFQLDPSGLGANTSGVLIFYPTMESDCPWVFSSPILAQGPSAMAWAAGTGARPRGLWAIFSNPLPDGVCRLAAITLRVGRTL